MPPAAGSDLLEQARTRILAAIPDAVAIYAFGSTFTDHIHAPTVLRCEVIARDLEGLLDFSERAARIV